MGAGLLLSAAAWPACCAEPAGVTFRLATKTFRMDYAVAKDGALVCAMKNAEGREVPVHGQVFPVRTITPEGVRDQRYSGPVSVLLPNGDNFPQLVYDAHSVARESPGVEHATVVMRDSVNRLRVELHVRAYRDESILEQWTTLSNNMDQTVFVQRLDSAFFQTADNTHLEWFDCRESSEAERPVREKLARGIRMLETRQGNRHISGPEPFFALGFGGFPEEDQNVPCLVAALAWTGSARFAFELHESGGVEVSCGVNQPRPVPVDPGKSIASPALVYSYSAAGKGPASRNFHRWIRRYGIRDANRLRLVDNNSWEGCGMNVSEKSVLEMMKLSAELGIELYVMDDGWFGNDGHARWDDTGGLGDWQVNKQRFPNGLEPLIKAGKANNIAFGLWFEPEMVNPRSELFKKHPEWVMRVPGRELVLRRSQAVLDMANPDVQDFAYHAVADILAAHPGIRFVKWDANSSINNPYSPFLGPDRQGEMLNRYMAGLYGVLQKLVTAYPQVDFQACASGGARADLGIMKYSHTFWPSDNTNPAYRLGAIWNFSTCLPPMAITCHVTHAGGNEFPPKYRFDVAMMGQLGMEVDPRKAEANYLAAAKVGIAAYKSIREIVQFGDQYRHQSPFTSPTPSLNDVSADQNRALLLAFQTGAMHQPAKCSSPVAGLDPARHYRVAEINLPPGDDQPRLDPSAKLVQSGSEWMAKGVPLIFSRRFDSAAVTLIAVTNDQ
ncbi:MAG: alpha-galactosidase [Kiritimatiellaeota bacterium]|nr:alpha-galactosidase [Kiritimatiellota bacterium]